MIMKKRKKSKQLDIADIEKILKASDTGIKQYVDMLILKSKIEFQKTYGISY